MKKIAIGIDFSKKTFDVTIMRRDGDNFKELAYSKFDNESKGFKGFISWVRKSVKPFPEGKGRSSWLFCGENTGVCSAALSDFLAEKGYDMWLESALQIKKKSGIVRDKNDKDDSRRIADYALRQYSDKVRLHEPDSKNIKKLKALYAAHNMLTKDKVAKTNQIKSGTLDCCPEALKLAEKQLSLIEKQLGQIDDKLEDMLEETEEFRRNWEIMNSMKGVGVITACCIIIKTHNFKYMSDSRTFGNYAGVVPSRRDQSGTSVDIPPRVSKFRDRESNCALTQCANSAIRYNPVIRSYYQRLIARGVLHRKARNNCKFKIINILMTLIKNDTLFDEEKYGKAKSKWPQAV